MAPAELESNIDMDGGLDLSLSSVAKKKNQLCCDLNWSNVGFSNRLGVERSAPVNRWATIRTIDEVKDHDLQRPQTPMSVPPANDPAPQSTDALVARELLKLSLDDRNRVFEEIHGVEERTLDVQETDEILDDLLIQLGHELSSVSEKSAFAEAHRQNPDYVARRDLRIKFLRAESYRPEGAASRMLAYFDYKLELFGTEKLTKDIRIQDLLAAPDDREALESGLFQTFPIRDRAGRIVITKFPKHKFSLLPLASRLRVFFYLLMTTTEHDWDQQRGIVFVVMNTDGFVDRTDAWRSTTLLGALPVKLKAFHVGHNDPRVTVVKSIGMLAMGPEYRARFRCHEGSIVEIMYALSSFGIPSHCCPVHPSTGDVTVDSWHRWLQNREVVEAVEPTLDANTVDGRAVVPSPTDVDVLLGRGRAVQNHMGNLRLREVIDAHQEFYNNARSSQKTEIAELVVHHIRSLNGRFLKVGDAGWEEVDDSIAREKISHTFRDRRRTMKHRDAGTK